MFWKNYNGFDATAEIIVMLLVAFLLGVLFMYLYDKFLFECVDEDDRHEISEENRDDAIMGIIDADQDTDTDVDVDEHPSYYIEPEVTEVKKGNDDLKVIEGIGPKIESILKSEGVTTLKNLSKMKSDDIKEILIRVGGDRYAFHDPTTWPDQAMLAADNKWEELNEYQEFLTGGRV